MFHKPFVRVTLLFSTSVPLALPAQAREAVEFEFPGQRTRI
jgi:hypothetical protein